MKKLAKVLSVALTLTLLATACKPKQGSETGGGDATGAKQTEQGGQTTVGGHKDEKVYTFNDSMGASPAAWSPHTWETDADSEFQNMITTPWTDVVAKEDGSFEFVAVGAEIKDITAEFKDKEKWGLTADDTKNVVYEISLSKDMTWDDGTPINADSYIYSMKQMLSSEMKNRRADSYYTGTYALRGAEDYFRNDLAGQTRYTAVTKETPLPEGKKMLLDVNSKVLFFGSSMKAMYEKDASPFMDGETDLYAKYSKGAVEITEAVQADLLKIASAFGDSNPEAWKEFAVYEDGKYEEVPFDKVGLVKKDDYTLQWILAKPLTEFYFKAYVTGDFLVKEDLYEKGKKKVQNLVATDYFTTAQTTASYGPYKLVSFEKDKQFILERNESWFKYKDPAYDNLYQVDKIKYDIISDHNTALQLFNQGKLDYIALDSTDLEKYRMSDNLMTSKTTGTLRFIFGTDLAKLQALEKQAGNNVNKSVLYYDDFRKAISLSMDRNKFTKEATSGYAPAYYLLNSEYYYDVENNSDSVYRKTDAAKQAVLKLYGIEYGEGKNYKTIDDAYNAVTGYNVEEAKALFQKVYEQAVKDGNYKDGQSISIDAQVSAATTMSPDNTKKNDLLNDFVTEATKGTGFEGKIKFNFKTGAPNRYEDVVQGKIEMIIGAWQGSPFNPFQVIRLYTDEVYMNGLDKIHESNGWNPTTEKLTITYDFDGDGKEESVEDTFINWAQSINGNGKYMDKVETRLAVLAQLEAGVLGTYQTIPFGSATNNFLHSKKVNYFTKIYNVMYGFGGLRQMTVNYDDAAWETYVKEQGGTLKYE